MIFSAPKPFLEAAQANQARQLLPTDLSSALLAELDPEIRMRARFSAKVRSVEHLSLLDRLVRDITDGRTGHAEGRLQLKKYLAATGYRPDPELEGTLQDFSSTARIDLQLRINVGQARGYGQWRQGQEPAVLDAFPAQEFLRIETRERERADWPERWLLAGGPRTDAWPRMIALKNDTCWEALSRFGTPWPPFDFNSGMGVRDIERDEAEELGLITLDEIPAPRDLGLNEELAATPGALSQVLRAALEATGLGTFDAAGVFRAMTNGM